MEQERELGFVAFWKATDRWFGASKSDKAVFMEKLDAIFSKARGQGVVMHGPYDCSWSSEWRYFSFWQCPTLAILEETMAALVEIGDINLYNEQHHYVGRKTVEALLQ